MASSTTIKIGLSQMTCGDDPKRNLAHQLALAEQALKKGAKIFCTQELFRSQYFCQVEDHRFFALAETIPGPSTDAFAKLEAEYFSEPELGALSPLQQFLLADLNIKAVASSGS